MKPAPKPAAVAGALGAVEAAEGLVVAAEAVLAAVVAVEEEVAIAAVVVEAAVADTKNCKQEKTQVQPASYLLQRVALHKVYLRPMRNNARLIAHIQQLHHRTLSVFAVIQSPIIYIHAHKAVCHLRVQIARKLHGIGQRRLAMVKRVLNAITQCLRHLRNQLRSQFATNRIPAQRQGQSGLLMPPSSQIQN